MIADCTKVSEIEEEREGGGVRSRGGRVEEREHTRERVGEVEHESFCHRLCENTTFLCN